MSVAAAVPHGQPPLLLDSTFLWSRGAAFASPKALPLASPDGSPTCCSTARLNPAPGVPQLLSCLGDEETLCDAITHGCGFDSDADGPPLCFCPLTCDHQQCWGAPVNFALHHSATPQVALAAAAAALIYGDGKGRSFVDAPSGELATQAPERGKSGTILAKEPTRGCSGTSAVAATGLVYRIPGLEALWRPSSPSPPPIPLPTGRSSNCGRISSGGAAVPTVAPRRPPYGVRSSAMTSQISAAQRCRAATLIQAAWRGFRIRRLYLRLIVWRLRPPAQQQDTYRGIREFPSIPDLPEVSLFTQYGRPCRFHNVKRRVWFGMEMPSCSSTQPRPAPTPHSPHSTKDTTRQQQQQQEQQSQQQQQQQQQPGQSVQSPSVAAAVLPPPTPQARRPGPRAPLRLMVPSRAEADVPMSEVERILAGGFWRVDEPRAGPVAGGIEAGGVGGGGGAGSSVEGEEGLSMYMRAKMRQEEREAEEALQMLSYEPLALMQKLGSLKVRTLERLGDLGRTIGETLSSGLLLGSRGHGHANGQTHGSHLKQHHAPDQGLWHWHWDWHWHSNQAPGQAGAGDQATSLPRAGRWGALGGGGGRSKLYCGTALALSQPSAAFSSCSGLGSGSCDWNLRMPLLTVVDAEGHAHTEVPPVGVAAIPIAVNWQRYRSRSHATRMSF